MKPIIHGADVTRFLHSRYWLLITIAALVATAGFYGNGSFSTTFSTYSSNIFGLKSPSSWTGASAWSPVIGIAATIACSALLYIIVTSFNLLRSMTLIYATTLIIVLASIPTFISHFHGGQLLTILLLAALCPLFSTYQHPDMTRRVFLSFLLLTVGLILCCPATAWVIIIPVFLAGIGQMRILSLRTALAALIGIATPLWILFGLGIIDTAKISATWPSAFTLAAPPTWFSLKTAIFMAVVIVEWLTLSAFNMLRIYSYNARLRAYNGQFTLLGLAILAVMILDPEHVPTYLPTFAVCLGLQSGHFFTINHGSRSWIGILTLWLPFWAIFIWITTL